MRTIAELGALCNAVNPSHVFAYCDGLELSFLKKPVGAPSRIERHRNEQTGFESFRTINNHQNGLTLKTLERLDEVQAAFGEKICALHIAIDVPPTPGLKDYIVRTAILKGRQAQLMEDTENVYSWGPIEQKHRRNLITYDDRHSKITGECEVVHLELRFRGSDVIRDLVGVEEVREVEHINPRELVQRHLKFTDAGEAGEAYIAKIVRKTVGQYRDRYRGKEVSAFMDRYIANVGNRTEWILRRLNCDRAQVAKDLLGVEGCEVSMFSIPDRLEWNGGIGQKTPIDFIG